MIALKFFLVKLKVNSLILYLFVQVSVYNPIYSICQKKSENVLFSFSSIANIRQDYI